MREMTSGSSSCQAQTREAKGRNDTLPEHVEVLPMSNRALELVFCTLNLFGAFRK